MILVSGYYGFDNLGDEAILSSLCADLAELGVSRRELVVPSGNPEKTAAEHGVSVLGRFDVRGIWRTLSSARCLISGGGSLLQDVTSRRSIAYYLSLVEMAQARKVPVIMYAQGLGPIRSRFFKAWTAAPLGTPLPAQSGQGQPFLPGRAGRAGRADRLGSRSRFRASLCRAGGSRCAGCCSTSGPTPAGLGSRNCGCSTFPAGGRKVGK